MRKLLIVALSALLAAGCRPTAESPSHSRNAEQEQAAGALPPGIIAVPPQVRENLGISFASVQRRPVARTMRLPGRFEPRTGARADYRALARGSVEILVEQHQRVEAGTPLFRLSSPEWTRLLLEIREAHEDAVLVLRQREAQQKVVDASKEAVGIWERRVASLVELRAAGAGQASQLTEAQSELVRAQAALAESLARMREAEHLVHATLDEATGANPRLRAALGTAALFLGADPAWLEETVDGKPRWESLSALDVAARQPGVVDRIEVPSGGLAEELALVVSTLDPASVQFRGFALQADIGHIADGMEVQLVPPLGGSGTYGEGIRATLRLGAHADPDERTIDFLAVLAAPPAAPWARPGFAAFAELVIEGSEEPEFAIPSAAVVRDDLESVFFLRDREDPDRVRRVPADLGASDGRWVAVNSGVRTGDEVVVGGAHELKLTGSGKAQSGGHFHSDGTFHAGEH